jgi:hypothetical protein
VIKYDRPKMMIQIRKWSSIRQWRYDLLLNIFAEIWKRIYAIIEFLSVRPSPADRLDQLIPSNVRRNHASLKYSRWVWLWILSVIALLYPCCLL